MVKCWDLNDSPIRQGQQITTTRTCLNVTSCRYLMPSNKARSLSTLIAVSVNKDAKNNGIPIKMQIVMMVIM